MDKLPQPYEPKIKNRFIATLPKDFGISNWVVKSIEMPSIEIGSNEWNPMKLRFCDPVGPSTSQILWNIYRSTIDGDDEKIPVSDKISKLVTDGFDIKVEYVDPTGQVVSVWEIYGCKITRIDFGKLDYTEVGISTCGITIKPTRVKLLY